MKRRKRHNPEQIVKKLHRRGKKAQTQDRSIGRACQALEISEATFHRWRNPYGGDGGQEESEEAQGARNRKHTPEEDGRRTSCSTKRSSRTSRRETCSPARRRNAVDMVVDEHEVSERRACCVAGQHRSTQRYEPVERNSDEVLVKRIHDLSRRFRGMDTAGSPLSFRAKDGTST
ncbi:MAG: hypothetical protein U5N86_00685 [Planctomycetota bacterium]|nr:hypothetical protein [Planctomycetota bacterium]